MNGLADAFQLRPLLRAVGWGLAVYFLCSASPAQAENTSIPWECSNYEGAAQIRCLSTFIELQREKIGQLEGELRAQQSTVGQLKNQIDRQAAETADLQRHILERPSVTMTSPPYPYFYPYAYPPAIGFGLSIGRPWGYGPFYRPYWGVRFHRLWW